MIRKGLWSPEEDEKLRRCISKYVNGSWNDIAKKAGLERCGRSCRQRWLNHLRPGLRKEKFTRDEVKQVMELQSKLGNRWSEIAGQMKGRTDNEVKNLWNTVIKRRLVFSAGGYSCKADRHREDNPIIDSSQLDPHSDSPSHTASSQSASSSHSSTCAAAAASWNLHVNPSPADVEFCSTLTSHASDHHLTFLDELYLATPQQLLMINGPDLMQADMNGEDQSQVDQHAASSDVVGSSIPMQSSHGLVVKEDFVDESTNFSCQSLIPTFEFSLPSVAHGQQTLFIPALSPSLDPHWDSSAKLVDVDANFPYTLSTQSFQDHSFIQDSQTPPSLISYTPNTYAFQNNSIIEGGTFPSKTLESISSIEGLRSVLLPQQNTVVDSQALPPSPPQLINFIVHEDKDYSMVNLGTCDHAHHDLGPACFNHRHEYSTLDVLANLMWSTGGYE